MKTSKTILIAEDDDSIIEVMKIILEEEGYFVTMAKKRDAIGKEITKKRPDLIFLDVNLGGENGEEIARELRGNEATKSLPLVMLSADNETETIAKKVKADGFLLKPFEIDSLIKTVEKYAV
jgi:CheY-like chemotaxis protein